MTTLIAKIKIKSAIDVPAHVPLVNLTSPQRPSLLNHELSCTALSIEVPNRFRLMFRNVPQHFAMFRHM